MAFVAVCTFAAALLGTLTAHAPTARAGGVGEHGLQLTVTVNTRPGLGALQPGIRVGAPVVKVYRLTNRSGADLSSVRLADPDVPPSTIDCGGSAQPGHLRALSSTVCTARFPAVPGLHIGWTVASGTVPSLAMGMKASARSGYTGVGGRLSLAESSRLTSFTEAEVRYVLTNPGNRAVYDIQLTDPVLAPGRIDCGGRAGVPELSPGMTVTCTAQVGRPPGTYHSAGTAGGSDWTVTLGPAGGDEGPPVLTAHADTSFTLLPPPAMPPPLLPGPQASGPRVPGSVSPRPRGAPSAQRSPTVPGAARPAAPAVPAVPFPFPRSLVLGGTATPLGQPPAAPGAPAPGAPLGAAAPPSLFTAPLTAPGPVPPPGALAPAVPPVPLAPPGIAAVPPGPGAPPGVPPAPPAAPPDLPGAPPGAAAVPPAIPAVPPAAPAVPPGPGGGVVGAAPVQPPAPVAPPQPPPPRPPQPPRGGVQQLAIPPKLPRGSKESPDMSMVVVLLLLLVPGALAAALLGSRRP
ncbi:hypothetical protein [Streptomyces crystallinus]|uniref:Uncharacterized protein n=1 Tax=Streptomyces crystallinus TaxID=68191 RepID=A0ABN1FLU5_9ACTN